MKLFDGETFEVRGHTFRVNFKDDDASDAPWDMSDGHGPVREVQRQRHERTAKRPGERFLNRDPGDSRITLYAYDWQAACKLARRDGWNAEPFDAPGRVQRAVQADFDFLSGWVNDEWRYVGVTVTLMHEVDGETEPDDAYTDSLWGVESYKDYHCEVAHDLANGLADQIEADQTAREAETNTRD